MCQEKSASQSSTSRNPPKAQVGTTAAEQSRPQSVSAFKLSSSSEPSNDDRNGGSDKPHSSSTCEGSQVTMKSLQDSGLVSPNQPLYKSEKRRTLRPDRFSGNDSFELFKEKFENCSKYNEWDQEEKKLQLINSVTGSAAQLLYDLSHLSYDELLDRLRSRYGSENQRNQYRQELCARRRKPSETLRALADDIERLSRLAHPELSFESRDQSINVDRFIDALTEPLRQHLKLREPKTLNKALSGAMLIETVEVRRRPGSQAAYGPWCRGGSESSQPVA